MGQLCTEIPIFLKIKIGCPLTWPVAMTPKFLNSRELISYFNCHARSLLGHSTIS